MAASTGTSRDNRNNLSDDKETMSSNNTGYDSNNKPNRSNIPWMDYIKEQFHDMVDEQRMERLQACRQIEDVYKDCRRYNKLIKQQRQQLQAGGTTVNDTHNHGNPKEPTKIERTLQLEDIPPGIRIVRYYDWRNIHDYDNTSNCIREKHAIWSCRASALQCGKELVQLRNCFNDIQVPPPGVVDPIYKNKNYGAVLNVSTTAYEPKDRNSTKDIPCREFQEKMGSCIAKNASELAEREMRRSMKQQQQK